jgi:TctA family transporter
VLLTLAFGVLGYLMKNYRFEPAPVLLGFVLGPLLEDNFRRTMLLYGGDFTIFLTRPISAVLVACSALLIGLAVWSSVSARRKETRSEV